MAILLEHVLAYGHAGAVVVGGDQGVHHVHIHHVGIEVDHGDVLLLAQGEDGLDRSGVNGAQKQAVDALSDHVLALGNLGLQVALGIGRNQHVAVGLDHFAHRRLNLGKEGVVVRGDSKSKGDGFVRLGCFGHRSACAQNHQRGQQHCQQFFHGFVLLQSYRSKPFRH